MRFRSILCAALLLGASSGFAPGFAPAFAAEPAKIAFVDTGNTGRSLAAEAMARQAIAARHLPVAVISRGLDRDPFDLSPEPNMATLLGQHGMDVTGHAALPLDASDVKHADLVLTMTAKHKAAVLAQYPDAAAKVFTVAEFATGAPADVADAYGKPMDVYEQVYAQIGGYMPVVLDKAVAARKPE